MKQDQLNSRTNFIEFNSAEGDRLYNRKITVFIDQDGPLADFEAAANAQGLHPKDAKMKRGFYRDLPVVKGAVDAVRELCQHPDVQVFIATKIPNHNPYAATEKLLWIAEFLPEMEERVIITPNKACLGKLGDFLIDDRAHKADAGFFPGEFIHFLSPKFSDWNTVMAHLRSQIAPAPPLASASMTSITSMTSMSSINRR